jgi:hypothetical protein
LNERLWHALAVTPALTWTLRLGLLGAGALAGLAVLGFLDRAYLAHESAIHSRPVFEPYGVKYAYATPPEPGRVRGWVAGMDPPAKAVYPKIEEGMLRSVADNGLVAHPSWMLKNIQLYETTLVRHGIMLVGPTGGGKSQIFNTLTASLAKLNNVSTARCA